MARDSMSSRLLLSWVWWCEDGTRQVPGAPSLGGRYVANTADVSCTPLPVLVPGWGKTLGLSRPH